MNWFLMCVKEKYADFSGRAHRSEYWYFVLFYMRDCYRVVLPGKY